MTETIHTYICPGCQKHVDKDTGLISQTQPDPNIISWWHSECRDKVRMIFDSVEREHELVGSIAQWLIDTGEWRYGNDVAKTDARNLLDYIGL